MTERVLTIEEAADFLPVSKSSLYRAASAPDSPFRKRAGRWMTTESDLIEWVRTGEKPKARQPGESPMPRPRKRGDDRFEALVEQYRRAA